MFLSRVIGACRLHSFYLLVEVQLILRRVPVCQRLARWEADEGTGCRVDSQGLVEIRSRLVLLIIGRVLKLSVNSRIVAIASHIARFCKLQPTTALLDLSESIILKVVRVLMS
jgi:hypothetical protein